MERHKTQNNPVQEWINKDSNLSNILLKIEKRTGSIEKQAEIAFHLVAEEYNLPKMPQDIDYENQDKEMKSVYEILGLVNYVLPEEDPRGNVMFALCCVYYNLEPDMEDFWKKANQQGYDEGNVLGIGYLGENYNVKIKFVIKGEAWSDYGFNLFTKFDTIT